MELDATASPVGLLPHTPFPSARQTLTDGEKLVIYTDGVSEAQNPRGEFFGRKRLREIVAAHATESCTAMHEAIQSGVVAFTESAPQSDDITVLVLEYRAGERAG